VVSEEQRQRKFQAVHLEDLAALAELPQRRNQAVHLEDLVVSEEEE